MPRSPKMIESPIAISTYKPPRTRPLAVCDRRMSSIVYPDAGSAHLAADFLLRAEHLVEVGRVLGQRRLDVEEVPLVGDLVLHRDREVAHQHLVIELAVAVGRVAGRYLPGFERLDDLVGAGRLRSVDRFEQRARRDPAHPRLVCRRLAMLLEVG